MNALQLRLVIGVRNLPVIVICVNYTINVNVMLINYSGTVTSEGCYKSNAIYGIGRHF